jgi:hypothetical protein
MRPGSLVRGMSLRLLGWQAASCWRLRNIVLAIARQPGYDTCDDPLGREERQFPQQHRKRPSRPPAASLPTGEYKANGILYR